MRDSLEEEKSTRDWLEEEKGAKSKLAIAVGLWLILIGGFLFVVFLVLRNSGYWFGQLIARIVPIISPVVIVIGALLVSWGVLREGKRRQHKDGYPETTERDSVRRAYNVCGGVMIAAGAVFFSLFLFPSDRARYCMFIDLGFLLVAGIVLLIYRLTRRELSRAYVVSGTIMIAVATIFFASLYFTEDWSLYSMFGSLGFLIVAGIILLVYASIRRD